MRVFGASLRTATISTTATAQYLGGRGCIYALTGGTGINLSGGGSINTPNCNVISNQSITGRGAITAAAVGAHNRSIGSTPPAITGTLQASDPLSYLNRARQQAAAPTSTSGNQNHGGTQTLVPGTYSEIVLQARIPGRRGTPRHSCEQFQHHLQARHVRNQRLRRPAKSGGLDLEGTGTLTGTRRRHLLHRPRRRNHRQHTNDSSDRSEQRSLRRHPHVPAGKQHQPATITGNGGGSYMEGALYFPNATLNLAGAANNADIDYMILVAKSLNITTTVNNLSNYSSLPNGYSPVRTTALVQYRLRTSSSSNDPQHHHQPLCALFADPPQSIRPSNKSLL